MQNFDSPGNVITIPNAGAGAVAVLRNQPYALGTYRGFAQGDAEVGEDLNLCVSGVFMTNVSCPNTGARVGTIVHLKTSDRTLHAGIGDSPQEGMIAFGQIVDGLARAGMTRVKVLASTAAAGSGVGGTDPEDKQRLTDLETNYVVVGNRLGSLDDARETLFENDAAIDQKFMDLPDEYATRASVAGLDDRTASIEGFAVEATSQLQDLDTRVTTIEQAGGGGGGGGSGAAALDVMIIDVDASTAQTTFGALHNIEAYSGQQAQSGAIQFNREAYVSGSENIASLANGAWIQIMKDGLYEIEYSNLMLDQTLQRSGIGFMYEELQLAGDNGSSPNSLNGAPPLTNFAPNYPARLEFEAESELRGQGVPGQIKRGDILFFCGENAPYADRKPKWKWRVFLRQGAAIRIFGRMYTVGSYLTTQMGYGLLNNPAVTGGTPEARYSNTLGPTLIITRIA